MIKYQKLTAFHLKIIALITMTIDHIGYYLFPNEPIFRIVGRLSFVIFAYLTANAYIYTSNKKKHLLLLLLFAIIYSFVLFFNGIHFGYNIFLSLSIGYILIYFYDNQKYILLPAIIVMTYFLNIDYGIYGIVFILCSYIFHDKIRVLTIINIILIFILYGINHIQLFSSLSFVLLYLYNNEKGHSLKYFFYLYYPLHIFILYYLSRFI